MMSMISKAAGLSGAGSSMSRFLNRSTAAGTATGAAYGATLGRDPGQSRLGGAMTGGMSGALLGRYGGMGARRGAEAYRTTFGGMGSKVGAGFGAAGRGAWSQMRMDGRRAASTIGPHLRGNRAFNSAYSKYQNWRR